MNYLGETKVSICTAELDHGTTINAGKVYPEGPGLPEGATKIKGEPHEYSCHNGKYTTPTDKDNEHSIVTL